MPCCAGSHLVGAVLRLFRGRSSFSLDNPKSIFEGPEVHAAWGPVCLRAVGMVSCGVGGVMPTVWQSAAEFPESQDSCLAGLAPD